VGRRTDVQAEPEAGRPPRREARLSPVMTLAVGLIGAGACYVVGGAGYGITAEYGNLWGGGLWQVVVIGAIVVGAAWGGIALLLLHVSGAGANAVVVVTVAVAVCFLAGVVGGQLGEAAHTRAQEHSGLSGTRA
jgi:hypothetical protein